MSENDYKRIFSRNLKKYMALNGKEQIDLINDLNLNKSAVSTWCNGTRLPRMDKVQLLADYFRIEKSDLIEEKTDTTSEPDYFYDEDARDLAQFMYNNPEYKVLFDTTRKVKREDIEFVKQMIDRVRGDNNETGC